MPRIRIVQDPRSRAFSARLEARARALVDESPRQRACRSLVDRSVRRQLSLTLDQLDQARELERRQTQNLHQVEAALKRELVMLDRRTPTYSSIQFPEREKLTRKRGRGWAHFIRKVWIDDPEECGKCGGSMKIVAALSSPEQDDIIRAILESTGQWDPPWNRRGPPPTRTDAPADSSEPTIEYDVDPDSLWPDD